MQPLNLKHSPDRPEKDCAFLRRFAIEDADELLDLFRDPEIRRYLLDDSLVERDWVLAEVKASDARFDGNGAGLWSVRLEQNGEIVGFAGFREFFDPPKLQLLYGLHPVHWGKGLATEIAAEVCRYAFRELHFTHVSAAIDVPNLASERVLKRLGMRLERVTDDGPAGTAFYTLDHSAWVVRRPSINVKMEGTGD